MTGVRFLLAAVLAAFASGWAHAAPLAAYGSLPTIEAASISPDGRRVAFIATNDEDRVIVLRDLEGGPAKTLSAGKTKVREIGWAGPRYLLITATRATHISGVIAPRGEYAQLFIYDTERDKLRNVMQDVTYGMTVMFGGPYVREVDGRLFIFLSGVHFPEDGQGQIALYRYEPERDKLLLEHKGFPNTREWLVGAEGKPTAVSEYDPKTGKWEIKAPDGPRWNVALAGESLIDPPELVGLGRTPDSVLVADADDEEYSFREFFPATRTWGEGFSGLSMSAIFDPADQTMIGYRTTSGDETRYVMFRPADQQAWDAIGRAFPGQSVTLADWSTDRKRIVVLVDSPTEGPGYALVDLDTKQASWLGQLYLRLAPEDISPVRAITFKASDGTPLSGYLTLPQGRSPTGLPLVVLPHGGPQARDYPGFDWWAQAMASRGYAVLQVNYRGSAGFGQSFLEAGYGEWGGKMQTDLSDGVAHVAADGVIDPARVCIVGASYGGYAALAGVSLQSDVYRCAAAFAGVSDLQKMVTWIKPRKGELAERYWLRYMGADDETAPVLRERSPAAFAHRITAPVLLIHGNDDTVVGIEQSREMAKAMEAAGKPVEFITLPGEDHYLSRGQTRLEMLEAIVGFLERHNPPG